MTTISAKALVDAMEGLDSAATTIMVISSSGSDEMRSAGKELAERLTVVSSALKAALMTLPDCEIK